ncbi:MAG: transketolase [Thermodesulfobacteriota bacterium]
MKTDLPAENISDMETLAVNTLRTLSIDAIEKANSGHPGAPMGMAPAAYALWTRFLKHNPKNHRWIDRDRFVLSAGHASMMLYGLLYLTGYPLTIEDLKQFRQWGSLTPGHPEYKHTPGVETTTGPLGQGIATAVGMAMAERQMAAFFNRTGHDIIDHHTYVMCGDGDLMEGISSEAASLAGHLGLSKLICLYDDNDISIEGSTDITFTENVARRFEAQNWHVLAVSDGNDLNAISDAISTAKAETEKPSLIVIRTHIAYGSPNKQGKSDAHGAPLGEEEVRLTKASYGCPVDERFCVPEAVLEHFQSVAKNGEKNEKSWNDRLDAYKKAYPELAETLLARIGKNPPKDWDAELPDFKPEDGPMATRKASGIVLNALAKKRPDMIGGSADLAPSNNTVIKDAFDFQKDRPEGRNIRFGVREHAMGAIVNGFCVHGGFTPFCGTFLVFADYMRPAVRLSALMGVPAIYVFTHDSLAVGEDGPTHQPVEHLASLRAIPNLLVIRPADATETTEAWKIAVYSENRPTALLFSRQSLPVLDRGSLAPAGGVQKGAYVLSDAKGKPDIILLASGAEVHIALEAQKTLADRGIAARVVSMPSWELFEEMDDDYKKSVLPPDVTARLSIEAGITMGWERYVGIAGGMIGVNRFGASAPGGTVMKKYGFTAENAVEKALAILGR